MRSTMQEFPLSVATIVRYATTVHADSEVVTWTGTDSVRRDYGTLGRRAARLANGLRALGVDGDQRVGSFMWNNAEHMEAYAAVPAMGAVLHTLNIRLFPEQLVYIANHAEDEVIICDGSLVPMLAKLLPEMKTVRHVLVTGDCDPGAFENTSAQIHAYEEVLAAQSEEFPWAIVDERDAAAMCYTSGTTGNPKGVAYSHRSIYLHSLFGCTAEAFGMSEHDRVLAVVPMFHAMAWGMPYAAMMGGASMLMPDRFLQPEPLAAFIAAERPTVAGAVPTVWSALLGHLDANPVDVRCLRDVFVGGSACPPAMMKGYEERHGVRLVQAWGMTETSPIGSVGRPPVGASEEEAWAKRISQGRLPVSVEARLVGDAGTPLPHDGETVGELEVRGPWVTGSYYRGPGDSADVDPERFRDGWLRTGDVGTLTPDGYLTLTDRSKDVIKSGGEWISSVDLENAIMGHPAVAEAAVIGVPDDRWDERPLAAVVPRPGAEVTFEDLRAFLGDKIAKWQLPERWAFIPEVPKTSVGKFDKKVLRQQYADDQLEVTRF